MIISNIEFKVHFKHQYVIQLNPMEYSVYHKFLTLQSNPKHNVPLDLMEHYVYYKFLKLLCNVKHNVPLTKIGFIINFAIRFKSNLNYL